MQTRLLFRRAVAPEPTAPFDVPDDGVRVGLRRCGDTLVGVIGVGPTTPAPLVVGAAQPGDARLMAAAVAALGARDAAPSSVDVVTHTMACWGNGPAARAYRGLLGGQRIAAHRSVHLVVRIRPADWPDAVRSRGDAGTGALRTALWVLRRLCARLADDGVVAHPLAAAEIAELTARFTEGIPVWSAAEAPIGVEHNGSPLVSYVLRDARPEAATALLATPVAVNAVSTTVTVSVTPGPSVRVSVRDNGGRAVDRSGELGLELVTADRRAIAAAGLPIDVPTPRRRRSTDDISPSFHLAASDAIAVPLAGDGQIVGADASDRPVTLRMAGRDIPHCDVMGDGVLHRQVVARLAALGFAVAVATDHPQQWRRLAASVGTGSVTVGHPQHPIQVIVDDTEACTLTAPRGTTLLRLRDAGAPPPSGRGPMIRQSADGGTVVARGSGRTVGLRLVSTTAERAIVER
ncbi:type VII secretion protein EccE [Gordonia phthalatica]|uniref:Type VII secretion system protein EccE domain-containing protein n=1 Tax=Gordonia phthalatica TaxID=1136941 RepID=A0A0N9N9G6_9ACTN|nr:type VII secretion protein EccE [Gordonia phthalatica]ALG84044.1 hypothetical protein ACH46_05390 [Gordonia phthalatica]